MTDSITTRLHERAESYRMSGPSAEHTAVLLDEAAALIDDLCKGLDGMLQEFDDPTITDDIKTQVGMSANTVKALQFARALLSRAKATS
jgi:hypothetical protein